MAEPGTVKYWEQQHTDAINRAQISEVENRRLKTALEAVKEIAWDMPAPNPFTPRIVHIVIDTLECAPIRTALSKLDGN